MKIGIILPSSQKSKNLLLENVVEKVVKPLGHEVINLGVFDNEDVEISYVDTAFLVSLLLESGKVDFVITGCSSGQGMALACNSFPGVICGYVSSASDAYLFGRINSGNAISYPLGLGFGWASEINMESTIKALFCEDFGIGYPKEDAKRKMADTAQMHQINKMVKGTMPQLLGKMDKTEIDRILELRPRVKALISDFYADYLH